MFVVRMLHISCCCHVSSTGAWSCTCASTRTSMCTRSQGEAVLWEGWGYGVRPLQRFECVVFCRPSVWHASWKPVELRCLCQCCGLAVAAQVLRTEVQADVDFYVNSHGHLVRCSASCRDGAAALGWPTSWCVGWSLGAGRCFRLLGRCLS